MKSSVYKMGSIFLPVLFLLNNLYAQAILPDVPKQIQKDKDYLFYLHGRIIEVKGERPTDEQYGVYEYRQILDTLANKGFLVISEVRKDTNRLVYADKVVGQIKALLRAGVPPVNITVVGASKGAVITMMVSTKLQNRQVNFVPMAGCNEVIFSKFPYKLYGNVLSIYDADDVIVGSCRQFFADQEGLNRHKEVVLHLGLGHGVLYKPYREWVDLVVDWAMGNHS